MYHRVAAVLMALQVVSCSQASPTAPTTAPSAAGTPTVHISGRVIDYQTGKTVSGTSIEWTALNSGSPSRTRTTSDVTGRFDVELPAVERYQFQIQTGPINFQSGLVRTPWKRLESDILVNAGTCAARYGYVFDAVTREPIEGARVAVRAGTVFTDGRGYYRIDIGCVQYGFEHWGIGTTTIGVSHGGYQFVADIDGRSENISYSGIVRRDFALQPLQ
jgi:hypothetical protein